MMYLNENLIEKIQYSRFYMLDEPYLVTEQTQMKSRTVVPVSTIQLANERNCDSNDESTIPLKVETT